MSTVMAMVIDERRAQADPVGTGPWIDEHGLLRLGAEWVALPDIEWRIMDVLVRREGQLVPRNELAGAGWPDQAVPDTALNVRIQRLRRRLTRLGLTITTVRGRGYVLGTSCA